MLTGTEPEGLPMPPAAQKPAKKFLAVAVHAGGGFLAQWAAPGLIPDYVRDYSTRTQNPPPLVFESEDAAEFAALRAMRNAMNDRKRSGSGKTKDVHFDKMTGGELAVAIAEVPGMDFELMADLCGYTLDYLNQIIDEMKSVPFIMRWAVPLLARHDNLDFAIQAAAKHMKHSHHFRRFMKLRGIKTQELVGRIIPTQPPQTKQDMVLQNALKRAREQADRADKAERNERNLARDNTDLRDRVKELEIVLKSSGMRVPDDTSKKETR